MRGGRARSPQRRGRVAVLRLPAAPGAGMASSLSNASLHAGATVISGAVAERCKFEVGGSGSASGAASWLLAQLLLFFRLCSARRSLECSGAAPRAPQCSAVQYSACMHSFLPSKPRRPMCCTSC